MMDQVEKNKQVIENFYNALNEGNIQEMMKQYHSDVIFEDPGFGKLDYYQVVKMWEMLISKRSQSFKLIYKNVEAHENVGSVNWIVTYHYSATQRKVVNNIMAQFKFCDGKIIEHKDSFNLWKWTRQALGISGYLLGWTAFMRKKLNQGTKEVLEDYIQKNPNLPF